MNLERMPGYQRSQELCSFGLHHSLGGGPRDPKATKNIQESDYKIIYIIRAIGTFGG